MRGPLPTPQGGSMHPCGEDEGSGQCAAELLRGSLAAFSAWDVLQWVAGWSSHGTLWFERQTPGGVLRGWLHCGWGVLISVGPCDGSPPHLPERAHQHFMNLMAWKEGLFRFCAGMPPEAGLPIEERLDRLLLRTAHALDESSPPAGPRNPKQVRRVS